MRNKPELALLSLFALLTPALKGHDGGFGHSRRTIFIAATDTGLTLEYRIVMNRDEALAEMALMDVNRDGEVSAAEKDKYFTARGKQLAKSLSIKTKDGEALTLEYSGYGLDQALTQTFRFNVKATVREVLLDDRAFPHKPGLVQIRHGKGLTVEQAVPTNLAHAERVNLRIRKEE